MWHIGNVDMLAHCGSCAACALVWHIDRLLVVVAPLAHRFATGGFGCRGIIIDMLAHCGSHRCGILVIYMLAH